MFPLLLLVVALQEPAKLNIVEYGIYAPDVELTSHQAAKTNRGFVRVVDRDNPPELVEETTEIPAKVGTRFGVYHAFEGCGGPASYPITVRIHHPPMTNPKTGKTTTVEQWETHSYPVIATFTGYLFEDEWEAVPGEWRIELLVDGEVAASQKFQVVH